MDAFKGHHGDTSTPTSSLIGVAICIAGKSLGCCSRPNERALIPRLYRQHLHLISPQHSKVSTYSSLFQLTAHLHLYRLAHNRLTQPSPVPPSEREPLLAHHSDIPPRPALLQSSVSDPNLHDSDPTHILIPITPSPPFLPSEAPPPADRKSSRTIPRPRLSVDTQGSSSNLGVNGTGRAKSGSVSSATGSSRRGGSRERRRRPRTDKEYLREPLWWLGVGLMTLGEFGNFVSYSFAPASLVAPVSVR